MRVSFFFFNDTATTEIYTLSLHDALPIFSTHTRTHADVALRGPRGVTADFTNGIGVESPKPAARRSEEHTSELQSRQYLVCRLLLEKKKKNMYLIILSPSQISPYHLYRPA